MQGYKDNGASQVQLDPQVPQPVPSQAKIEDKIQQGSPPLQEEQASPSAPKKHRKIKIPIKKRKRVIRRMVPFPSILDPIHKEEEEEEEDEEEDVSLKRRT